MCFGWYTVSWSMVFLSCLASCGSQQVIIRGDATRIPLPDCSVDAVVTDPPYGLEFMGKEWDRPWAGSGVGSTTDGFADGSFKGFRVPDYLGSTNPRCLNCGKLRSGGKDKPWTCVCDSPSFPDTRTPRLVAFQAWCTEWAAECFRVLKPGGHLLAFGGTRTYHRMTCAIEDAGFEVRDCLAWLYGAGFPKSLNLDRVLTDDDRCTCASTQHDVRVVLDPDVPTTEPAPGWSGTLLLEGLSESSASGNGSVPGQESAVGTQPGVARWGHTQAVEGQLLGRPLREVPDLGSADGEVGRLHHGASSGDGRVDGPTADQDGGGQSHGPSTVEQPAVEPGAVADQRGSQAGRGRPVCGGCGKPVVPTGLGTAMKPAFEPVVLARKPLTGTVSSNVLRWGTGALNVDGCRLQWPDGPPDIGTPGWGGPNKKLTAAPTVDGDTVERTPANPAGRWPPNVALGHSPDCEEACEPDCPVRLLDEQSGERRPGEHPPKTGRNQIYGQLGGWGNGVREVLDGGGASRFFYVAKASRAERNAGLEGMPKRPVNDRNQYAGLPDLRMDHEQDRTPTANHHPTVKPLALMRWLVRLVTPPGGIVLDPFLGSGTTLLAAAYEGMRGIGIEREAEYVEIAKGRLSQPIQAGIF